MDNIEELINNEPKETYNPQNQSTNPTYEVSRYIPPQSNGLKKPLTTAEWLVSPQFKRSLFEILPKNLNLERVCRIALNELRKNPKLPQCSVSSFLSAVMQSTSVGLEIGEPLGHAYLIPRKIEGKLICCFDVGYKGLLELAQRVNALVSANLVYPDDEFYAEFGNDEKLRHVIVNPKGEYKLAYAYIRTKEDKFKMCQMYPHEINAIRDKVPSSNHPRSAWQTDYNAMARKTVIRQLFKLFPVSPEMAKAISLSEQAEVDIHHNDFPINITETGSENEQ